MPEKTVFGYPGPAEEGNEGSYVETGSRLSDNLTSIYREGKLSDVGLNVAGTWCSLADQKHFSGKTVLEMEQEHADAGTWTTYYTSSGEQITPGRDEAFSERGFTWMLSY